jgi:YihY family inner membrane protein
MDCVTVAATVTIVDPTQHSSAATALARIPDDPITAAFRERGFETLKYLTRTDVHTYAFSVAANAILSFFPGVVLLMTLIRRVFHSQAMYETVLELLRLYLPAGQDFIVRNFTALVNARKGTQVVSLIMLLVTSTGVFLPLEVALNQIWGFKRNRSYLGNQLVSLALAFAVGLLAFFSIGLAAGNQMLFNSVFEGSLGRVVGHAAMRICAILASVTIFFLIYWLLPNGKVPARAVLPAAMATGLLWEAAKYIYIAVLPLLDFKEVYGPFAISVSLMFWAFISGLLLLGGAHLSATGHRA